MKTSTTSRWEDAPDPGISLVPSSFENQATKEGEDVYRQIELEGGEKNERPESCLLYRRRGVTSFNG